MTQLINGDEVIQNELFIDLWDYLKDKCAGSEADLLHGYFAISAIKAVLEKALEIDPVEVILEEEDGE